MSDSEWTVATLKIHFDELRKADELRLNAAFEAAKEKSESHNALIEAMERQQHTFVTKGMVLTAMGAALTVLGLMIAYFANFGG